MTRQLSDCCKAPIDFYPKLERPECYRCSFCDRVIGSPIPEKSVKEIVEELMKHKTYFDTIEGKQGYILSERVKFYLTQTLQTERQKREEVVEDRPTVEDCQKLVDDGCGEWATKEELEQGTNTDGKIYPTQ